MEGNDATPPPRPQASSGSSQKRKRSSKRRRTSGANRDAQGVSGASEPVKAGDQEATQPKDDPPKATEWGCPACTYLNEQSRRMCEMCGTANPNGAQEPTAHLWSCVACTMKNPATLRMCSMCGTINPNPVVSSGLSISRGSLRSRLFMDDHEEDDDDDSDDESMLSSDESDDERRNEWMCNECGTAVTQDHATCPECLSLRPIPRRSLKRSSLGGHDESNDKHKKKKKKKKKKTQSPAAKKNAYGVSSEVLRKLAAEPTSTKLFDTLQTLTHTLAMMDASADSEWGEIHGGAPFLIHGFGAAASTLSNRAKDPELLDVLSGIFRNDKNEYSAEIRLFAIQSINYLLKMDRHLFSRATVVEIVNLYLGALHKWKLSSSDSSKTLKDERMLVEESVNGLYGVCGSEGVMLRELMKTEALNSFLSFLGRLTVEGKDFHASVVTSALDLFQRCCMKLKWHVDESAKETTRDEARMDLELAQRVITLLRQTLEHAQVSLRVKASKCLLLLFRRVPRSNRHLLNELVTHEVLQQLVYIVSNKKGDESDESRQAATSLLTHLFDLSPELVVQFVDEGVYKVLFEDFRKCVGSASSSVSMHVLKLVSLLVRQANNAVSRTDVNADSQSKVSPTRRRQFEPVPDPHVLQRLVVDFIRADSIAAVSTLFRDGADLNFPHTIDIDGIELEKPLVVAAEHASLEMVRFLVKRGADIHLKGATGTALHVAALAGRCDVVSFLLECGASPTETDRDGRSVIDRIADMESSNGSDSASPVQRLLDLHQRAVGMDHDSDASGDEEGFTSGARRWVRSFDDDDEFHDHDDEDSYYLDDDDEDDDEDMDDEDDELTSDEDEATMIEAGRTSGKKRRRESVTSDKDKPTRKRSDSDKSPSKKRGRSRTFDEDETASNAEDVHLASAEHLLAFSKTIFQELLSLLRAGDGLATDRGVLATLACVLEMAEPALIRELADSDQSLLLDTVSHLLQDATSMGISTKNASKKKPLQPKSSQTNTTTASLRSAEKAAIGSYILAFRILQAVVRKSSVGSSIFYQIERRGIGEQLERLLTQPSGGSTTEVQESLDCRKSLFNHGLALLDFLRRNSVETGMLHLHKLKNLARRLREGSSEMSREEKDLVLVDLVELFEQQQTITTHEFKQSELLVSLHQYLMPLPGNGVSEDRLKDLAVKFQSCPTALKNLVSQLQAAVNEVDTLPLISFFVGKGRELYPLTKQLRIVCSRLQNSSEVVDSKTTKTMLQLSPLTHFQSFERTVFRCMTVSDTKLNAYYVSLIGHTIQKVVDGKWKKFTVLGYDTKRGFHLFKPVSDPGDEPVEMVLHDSQYKLTGTVQVASKVSVKMTMFGELHSDSPKSSKKRNRSKKKHDSEDADTGITNESKDQAVEVRNIEAFNIGKFKGAWYAGVIVPSGHERRVSFGTFARSSTTAITPGELYTIKLLNGNTLRSVPSSLLRVRKDSPQVGSVVEVDGVLGEVTRVYESSDGKFDVRMSRDREKMGVKKNRLRYPPNFTAKPETIEAMSISRLFPARETSSVSGSVGDHVWIAPCESSPLRDVYISGIIRSYPSGIDAVNDPASVNVEVSFGVEHEPLLLKVSQSRVLNFSNGRNKLSSSRLLSALQMAGRRGGGSTLQQLLQSSGALRGGTQEDASLERSGSSGSAFDHLRQLISQASSRGPTANRTDEASDSRSIIEEESVEGQSAKSNGKKQKKKASGSQRPEVWQHLIIDQPGWKCARPPRVNVVVKLTGSEDVDSGFGAFDSSDEFPSIFSTPPKRSADTDESLTYSHPETGAVVLKDCVVSALRELFATFDGKESSGSANKGKKKSKKKRKSSVESSVETGLPQRDVSGISWDIEKFSTLLRIALGESEFDDPEGTLVDSCITFSRFATVPSRRQKLEWVGFLAAMTEACGEMRKARRFKAFLLSRGWSLTPPTDNSAIVASGSATSASSSTHENSTVSFEELQTFPSDQNMLKCIHDLQTSNGGNVSHSSPPWKYKYFFTCDFSVDWANTGEDSAPSTPTSKTCQSMPADSKHLSGKNQLDNNNPTSSSMAEAVRVLQHLHRRLSSLTTESGDDVWRNARLANKLETQLSDVLSVCSGIYPEWCDSMASNCRFFFPRELREKLFHATAFGSTRSLHWFRNELNVEDNASGGASAGGEGIAGDGIYNHEITISPIPKERVKVNRESLLSSAEAVMKMHGKRKAILDIVFVGEKGYGSGVTAAFYSATAQALQSVAENRNVETRLWIPGIENDLPSEPTEMNNEVIRHPNGLFPFPHQKASAGLIERFRMMGRLAGKALMDGRLLPLPLSQQFMKLVIGEDVSLDDLETIFLSHGRVLTRLQEAVAQLLRGVSVRDIQVDGMALEDWLEAVSLTFIDPLSQKPLEDGGDEKEVTVGNVVAYVEKVKGLWLHRGIEAQVDAFREGISEVLPLEKLKLLFVPELLSMLCGDADIDWDMESLKKSMKLAHGYTKESAAVEYFVEVLDEMTVAERREFLLYATGCPNLPAGGFAALRPPFEVVRRVVDNDNVDQALPFARTCTNTLHLPAYSSKDVMAERMRYAIGNSRGVIDRD
ncbi:hypothetical protein Poli38472_004007 [Pythium oligandrum]|uniref:HECT-type E3 ubiquitin transferase n=1 Tax=Pythium oligandrum TaxID=41045 RepID=A0A8K1FNU8_PYTOL|nr:hypothetical protein Poli38472_004007 [Pythium oligandrum]|eukprot:TMW66242.1 hypothetical protein Poli38472_004007 [Pythium oligandrum]